jgi:hypothetical protein
MLHLIRKYIISEIAVDSRTQRLLERGKERKRNERERGREGERERGRENMRGCIRAVELGKW